jgi:hypothetical protein
VGAGVNTAFIERLNATFRQRISPLTRRTRNLAQQAETLVAGTYTVGCFYFKVPPPRWEMPKQRGRPSATMLQLAQQWAV